MYTIIDPSIDPSIVLLTFGISIKSIFRSILLILVTPQREKTESDFVDDSNTRSITFDQE